MKISDDMRQLAKKINALTWKDMMAFSEGLKDSAEDLVRQGDFDAAGMALALTCLAEEILEHDEATHD